MCNSVAIKLQENRKFQGIYVQLKGKITIKHKSYLFPLAITFIAFKY